MPDPGDVALSAEEDGMDERRRFVETAQEKDGCCDKAKQDGEVVRYQILVYAEPGCHGRRAGQRARRTRQLRLQLGKSGV